MSIGVSEEAASVAETSRPFLGWRMAIIASLAQFISMGVVLSAIGNFVGPISQEFGVAPTRIGIAPGLSILAMGIIGPFVGRGIDNGRARQLMAAGACLTGVGMILGSRVTELWQLALTHTLIVSVGAALFGVLPSTALATNWFVRRQGLALGLVVAGATLASYPFPAIAQWMIENYDWRTSMATLGAFTLIVGVPVFGLLVVGRPESVGQRPDGDDPVASAMPDHEGRDAVAALDRGQEAENRSAIPVMEVREIARDARLWLAATGFGLILASPVVLSPLLVPYGESLGFTGQQATVFFAAMIPFSLLGKVVLGSLADVAPLKPSIALIVIVNILLWGLLYTEPGYPLFLACGAIYGIGIGGAAPIQSVVVARLFGRANFGRASGIGGIATIPLLVFANIGSQAFLGATNSYQMTFVVLMVALAIGGLLLSLIRIPEREGSSG